METMQELFYRDPYAREFSATVTACREGKKGFEVVLSDTAFYRLSIHHVNHDGL